MWDKFVNVFHTMNKQAKFSKYGEQSTNAHIRCHSCIPRSVDRISAVIVPPLFVDSCKSTKIYKTNVFKIDGLLPHVQVFNLMQCPVTYSNLTIPNFFYHI